MDPAKRGFEMPKISVIVPVYRVEDYLNRCVKSVLAQTFNDFELILVDDGSPDNCPAMCDAWAESDDRIKVIHKENGGLSDARNAGLDIAAGEYVSFLDSDDYFHPQILQALYEGLLTHDTAICLCKFVKTSGEPLDESTPLPAAEKWETERYYLHDSMNATIACAKLYRKECFDNVRYPVGKVHEDEFLTYRILFRHTHLSVVKAPLYGYFRNEQGITRSHWNPKRMMIFDAYEEQLIYFRKKQKPLIVKDRYHNYLWAITYQMEMLEETGDTVFLPQIRKRLREVLKRYRSECGIPFAFCTRQYEKAFPILILAIRLRLRLERVFRRLSNC